MAQALAVVVGLTIGGGPRVVWAGPEARAAESASEREPESERESEPESERESEPESASESASESEPEPEPEPEPASSAKTAPKAPAPVVGAPTISVAVGLAPEAPGSKDELALLDALELSAGASPSPTTKVRRLSIGSGTGRRICRQRRDDLVILVGYVPGRDRPVLLAHDCRLDTPLSVRAEAAASESGLVGALWDEREELVRGGMRERRTISKLSPRVRGGIIAGAAILVVGTAIGLLVATALRKERVVVTVSP